jgi:outer membrane biosynthesis protein TonB
VRQPGGHFADGADTADVGEPLALAAHLLFGFFLPGAVLDLCDQQLRAAFGVVDEPQEVAKAPEQPRREERPRTQEQPREQPRTEQKRETPKDDVLDQVAALLDKQKPSGGGAQRSTQEASLGASRTTGGEKLTQSEMDALRAQIQRCWNVPAGALDAQNLKVSLKFRLDPSGSVDGRPEVINGGGGDGVARAAAESARRAILQCAPYNLPADKYAAWADVIVHFDPSDMF